jgi:hypothetical protein
LHKNWQVMKNVQQQRGIAQYLRVLTGASKEKALVSEVRPGGKLAGLVKNMELPKNKMLDKLKEKRKQKEEEKGEGEAAGEAGDADGNLIELLGKTLVVKVQKERSYQEDFENYVQKEQDVSQKAAE